MHYYDHTLKQHSKTKARILGPWTSKIKILKIGTSKNVTLTTETLKTGIHKIRN